MKTEVFICVLCACLVLEAHKTSAKDVDTANVFTFLSYKPNTTQGPSNNVLVNGSKYEQMTNHTFLNETKSILERISLLKLAEDE
ncbi:uncharacterized protein LOC143737574 isoform X2 [Siphateles boraxobius]|uniref:uncharacterized protein LOC143737574 isoform X2 n=1 Tax=Siphateles boraxobius TaxID=180520 RepID=UPI00406355F8